MPKKYATRIEQLCHKKKMTVEERYEVRAILRDMDLAHLDETDDLDEDDYTDGYCYTSTERCEIEDEAEMDEEILRRYRSGESIRKLEEEFEVTERR